MTSRCDSYQHSELRERVATIRETPARPGEPWQEFIDFAGKLNQDIGPLFGRDAAIVAEYARSLEEQYAALERERTEAVSTAARAMQRSHDLQEQLEAVQKALRELHENMWMVSDDGGPEFISPEGLKYLRGWFERTEHLT